MAPGLGSGLGWSGFESCLPCVLSCVTWGQLLTLSGPPFPCLSSEVNNKQYLTCRIVVTPK